MAQEEFLRSVLELAPDGLMVVDHHAVIQLDNAQAAKLFDNPRNELVGERVEMLVPEHVREGHAALRASFHTAVIRNNCRVTKPIYPDAHFSTLTRGEARGGRLRVSPTNVLAGTDPALPQIEGIDTDGGLGRVAGNKRLYWSLLEQLRSRPTRITRLNRLLCKEIANRGKGSHIHA
jgi:PAS domain-containing protein